MAPTTIDASLPSTTGIGSGKSGERCKRILLAREEPHERSPPHAGVVPYCPPEHGVIRLERVEQRPLGRRPVQANHHLAGHAGEKRLPNRLPPNTQVKADGARKDWTVAGPFFPGWEIFHLKGSPVDPDRITRRSRRVGSGR